MKQIWTLALTLVLTAALFTGCGCTNSNKGNATTPTSLPTTMPTMPTMPSTTPSTAPTTQATIPTMEETSPSGNGMLEDEIGGSTNATESTSVAEGRARRAVPYQK